MVLLNGPPGVMEGLELPFYSLMPGVLRSHSFPLGVPLLLPYMPAGTMGMSECE